MEKRKSRVVKPEQQKQRVSIASASRRAKEEKEKDRERIKAALRKVDEEAKERVRRSSPIPSVPAATGDGSEELSEVSNKLSSSSLSSRPCLKADSPPQTPRTPVLLGVNKSDVGCDTSRRWHAMVENPALEHIHEEPVAKSFDRRRIWELEPFKLALAKYIQSDAIFLDSSTYFSAPGMPSTSKESHLISLAQEKQQKMLQPIASRMKEHSILPFLLLHEHAANKKKHEVRRGSAQTGGSPGGSRTMSNLVEIAVDTCDLKLEASTQKSFLSNNSAYASESFPSYNSASGVEVATTLSSPKESLPAHDSARGVGKKLSSATSQSSSSNYSLPKMRSQCECKSAASTASKGSGGDDYTMSFQSGSDSETCEVNNLFIND